ncbi:MAG: hypothetical protein R3D05_15175 [Dongiaceae bacterium]
MRKSLLGGMMIAALLATGGMAFADDMMPAGIGQTAKGDTLIDAHGMTLYVFDKDSGGKSVCNDKCAVNWPPLMAQSGAAATGDYSVVTRDDGSMQWAYKGRPLYTWIKDQKPGDVTGDGVANNTWHVAQP